MPYLEEQVQARVTGLGTARTEAMLPLARSLLSSRGGRGAPRPRPSRGLAIQGELPALEVAPQTPWRLDRARGVFDR